MSKCQLMNLMALGHYGKVSNHVYSRKIITNENFIITARLLNVVSDRIYEALAHHVTSTKANNQRLKYVTLWSLQLSAKGAIQTLKNVLGQSKAT